MEEFDPSTWDAPTHDETPDVPFGTEEWERVNNQLLADWGRFRERLREYEDQRKADGAPEISHAMRGAHIRRFRDMLRERYGATVVDERWVRERENRLAARGQQTSQKGRYAA